MALDYADLEQQAQDILRMETTVVTDWKRSWTNEARREMQRKHNWPEMLTYYPEVETQVGLVYSVAANARSLPGGSTFKEFAGENDGLYWVDGNGEHHSIPERPYSWLINQFKLSDTGDPEYCEIVRDSDGQTVNINVWPKPAQTAYFRIHYYAYMLDYGESQNLVSVSDFLIERAPLALRDALLREAYMALEMRDMTLFAAQANSVRTDDAISEARNKVIPDKASLIPSFRGHGPVDRSDWGYPWWGKR